MIIYPARDAGAKGEPLSATPAGARKGQIFARLKARYTKCFARQTNQIEQ